MLKYTLLAGAFGLAMFAPAYADHDPTGKCDEATMTRYQTDIDAMTDAEKKATSVKELEMAREAMAANKLDECMKFMHNAHQGARGGGDGGSSG